jgi:DedD protein
MRDFQHWRDKVELSLDGRQVFFLFFGGAVLACLLFALGVMTGRRLEARAIALEAPATDDPLAALDQLGDLEDEELTYHKALTQGGKGTRTAAPRPAKPAAPVAAPPTATAASKPTPMAAATVPAIGKPAPAAASAPTAAATPPAKPTPVAAAPQPSPLKGDVKESGVEASAVHFTLQLSAFSAKKDADDFARRVKDAGYRPFVVSSDLPGKGVLYRVRIGDFASKDAALAEKTAVEKKLKVAAYLAKL